MFRQTESAASASCERSLKSVRSGGRGCHAEHVNAELVRQLPDDQIREMPRAGHGPAYEQGVGLASINNLRDEYAGIASGRQSEACRISNPPLTSIAHRPGKFPRTDQRSPHRTSQRSFFALASEAPSHRPAKPSRTDQRSPHRTSQRSFFARASEAPSHRPAKAPRTDQRSFLAPTREAPSPSEDPRTGPAKSFTMRHARGRLVRRHFSAGAVLWR
jgi:hypothetical protein